jgi:hypothetical protein
MVLPDVHYGKAEDGRLDWRTYKDYGIDDDELLEETPPSVVEILGFDPLKANNDGE